MILILASFDSLSPWMLLAVPGILMGLFAQSWRHFANRRYTRVHTERQTTGAQVARILLDRNGMANVELFETTGAMVDHFDPSRRAIFLSPDVARGPSVAGVAIAAHEVGHAIQNRLDHRFFRFRMLIIGMTSLAASASALIFILGLCVSDELSRQLLVGSIVLYTVFFLLQIATLPVEYSASSRARKELLRHGLINPGEQRAVGRMLNAIAFTYVGTLLPALIELIRTVGTAVGRRLLGRNRD